MDGFEATAIIRKKGGSRIPIIALTANAMDGEKERCLASGMDDYLPKPVRADELVKKLEYWTGPDAQKPNVPVERGGTQPPSVQNGLNQFITSMEEEGISREETSEFLRSFLATGVELKNALEMAIDQKNGPLLARTAHTLKGTSATFGLMALADFASQLEKLGEGRQWDGAEKTLAQALSAYREAEEVIGQMVCVPAK